ncbi:MAG: hypothetical protein AAGD06_09860 [Acidobacteriota bacterium]
MKTLTHATPSAATPARPAPFFQPAGRSAGSPAPFFSTAPGSTAPRFSSGPAVVVQRQENGSGKASGSKDSEDKDPLLDGLKLTGEKALEDPEVEAFVDDKIDDLKKEWEKLPPADQAALISYGAVNLGLAGLAFGLNPQFRSLLSDVNIGKPLSWIPYVPIEGFKYKLPEKDLEGLGLSFDFTLNPYLELLRKKRPSFALSGLTFGFDTSLGEGGASLTGGRFGLDFLDGGLKLQGKSFKELSPYPILQPGSTPWDPSWTLMQSYPGLPPLHDGPGFEVMIKADMLKLFPVLKKVFF